jgi:hypothetical protein
VVVFVNPESVKAQCACGLAIGLFALLIVVAFTSF